MLALVPCPPHVAALATAADHKELKQLRACRIISPFSVLALYRDTP